MLKMKVEPTMCMKTQAVMTKCRARKPAFYTKMYQLRGNQQQPVGRFGRSCKHWAIVGGKSREPLEPALTDCKVSAGAPGASSK
jgi:hypothetical protein